jgi:hypothetical protein
MELLLSSVYDYFQIVALPDYLKVINQHFSNLGSTIYFALQIIFEATV